MGLFDKVQKAAGSIGNSAARVGSSVGTAAQEHSELTKKAELEAQIIELEKQMKNNSVLREKQAAEAEYLAEKSKLDKALGMDIISQQEYDERLAVAKKKVDNFEEIRRVEQQYSMKLITKEEKEAKIKALIE